MVSRSSPRVCASLFLALLAGCQDSGPEASKLFVPNDLSGRSQTENVEPEAIDDAMSSPQSRGINLEFSFDKMCTTEVPAPQDLGPSLTVFKILEAIDAKSCEEAKDKLRNVVSLDLSGRGIFDLAPLLGAPINIKSIDLSYNYITDVSPLAQTFIEELNISNNAVKSLGSLASSGIKNLTVGGEGSTFLSSDISKMKFLEQLNLERVDFRSAPIILNNPQLKNIGLAFISNTDFALMQLPENIEVLRFIELPTLTKVPDLSPYKKLGFLSFLGTGLLSLSGIENAPALTRLTLFLTAEVDLRILAPLVKLEQIAIYTVYLEPEDVDFSFVSNLKNLTTFASSVPGVRDLSIFSGLPNLQFLQLPNAAYTNLSSLTGLSKLIELSLGGMSQNQLASIGMFTNLVNFRCNACGFSNLTALSQLTKLKMLDLTNNRLTSLAGLVAFPQLESLFLSGTNTDDFSALTSLTQLKTMSIENPSTSLARLPALANLSELTLRGAGLATLEGITKFPNLKVFNLPETTVRDLAPLDGLPLKSLGLSNSQVASVAPLRNSKLLKSLALGGTLVTSLAPIQNLALTSLSVGASVLRNDIDCPTNFSASPAIRRICAIR